MDSQVNGSQTVTFEKKLSDQNLSSTNDSEFRKTCQNRSRPAVGSALGSILDLVRPIQRTHREHDMERGSAGGIGLPPIAARKQIYPNMECNWTPFHRKVQSAIHIQPPKEYQRWPSQQTTHQSADDWEMGFKRALDTCQNRAKTRECSPMPTPDDKFILGHKHSLTDISLPEFEVRVPQHIYGEEGCEWMDAYASSAPLRDSPFEPAPPIAPGVIILELTVENLRAHEYAASMAYARSHIIQNNPMVKSQTAQSQPPQIQQLQQPYVEPNTEKDLHFINPKNKFFGCPKQCVISIVIVCLWCAQLSLSVTATSTGTVSDSVWTLAYVAGIIGIMCSLFHLGCNIQSLRMPNSASLPQKFEAQQQSIIPRNTRHVIGFVSVIQMTILISGCVCLLLHSMSLSHCNGNINFKWFLSESQLIGLCENQTGSLLLPLVCIESILVLFALVRTIQASLAWKRFRFSAVVH